MLRALRQSLESCRSCGCAIEKIVCVIHPPLLMQQRRARGVTDASQNDIIRNMAIESSRRAYTNCMPFCVCAPIAIAHNNAFCKYASSAAERNIRHTIHFIASVVASAASRACSSQSTRALFALTRTTTTTTTKDDDDDADVDDVAVDVMSSSSNK